MKNHTPLPSDLEEGEQTPSLHSKRQEQLKKELQQKEEKGTELISYIASVLFNEKITYENKIE